MKRVRLSVAVLLLGSALALSGPAIAARESIEVKLGPHASLVAGSVMIDVRIRCEPFGEAFESNITVVQDDGRLFGQPGLPAVPCDDRWHTSTATVTPFEGAFHPGTAFASAFVSRLDPATGEVRQGQDVRIIRVR